MWCIGTLTEEYRHRMYALLELYARPMSRAEPVICIDEKSLQLIGHSRGPLVVSCGTKQSESLVVVGPGGHVGRLPLSLSTCPRGGCQEHGFERWN